MRRNGLFDFPEMYGYPSFGPFGGYVSEPDFGMQHHYPRARMIPNWCNDYYMPIEIPITHEKSPATVDKQKTEVKKPKFQENLNVCHENSPRKEIQHKMQMLPDHHPKRHSLKPSYSVFANMQAHSPTPKSASAEVKPQVTSDEQQHQMVRNPIVLEGPGMHDGHVEKRHLAEATNSSKTSIRVPKVTSTKEELKEHPTKPHSYKMRNVPTVLEGLSIQDEECMPMTTKTNLAKRPLTPMEQLTNIQKEMEELESRVKNFIGKKTDKEYIICDEMLTSLLLKLDMIESSGVEEIRNKRRELVKQVQKCLQKLESKVGIVRKLEESESTEMENTEAEDKEAVHKACSSIEMCSEQCKSEEQPECCDMDSQEEFLETAISSHVELNEEDKSDIQIDQISSLQLDQTPTQQMNIGETCAIRDSLTIDAVECNQRQCVDLSLFAESMETISDNASPSSTKDAAVVNESEPVSISED